ncbi:MAG TPA: UPF0175 family protein [Thermomicrobiales bacterium]|jgi:predicted HTH domain antitoxin|nr:UPF0175 family protein [Thermomicrobiales bacterium]
MATIQLDLDEDLLILLRRQDPSPSIEVAARELMVMELYRRGAVSRGKSAELLGIPLVEFLQRANELGIPYFDYTEEEWAGQMRQVEREVASHPSSPTRAH